MGSPTPNNPVVVNEDGSVSALIYRARTFRLNVTHEGLTDSTGYKARFGITDRYGNPLIAEASTDTGSITFSPAVLPETGTVISIEIPDEEMDFEETIKKGKLDLVLEEPGGDEIPVIVGDWIVWRDVTP